MNKHLNFLMNFFWWMQPCIEGSQVHSLIIHYDKFGDLVKEVLEEIVEEMYLTSWEVLGYYFVQRCLLPIVFFIFGLWKGWQQSCKRFNMSGHNPIKDLTLMMKSFKYLVRTIKN